MSTQPVAEDLSRMEGEYGAKMIGKLKQMSVFIHGLTGVGIETAKNLILAGPKMVTVQDDSITHIADLGTNFYCTQADVQTKTRGNASYKQLCELNPNVHVKLHTGPLSASFLHEFDVIVVCGDMPLKQMVDLNAIARARHGTPSVFIATGINGATGYVFSDFGPEHHVFDPDGVPAKSVIIDHISIAEHGIVTIDGDRHLLSDGDHVTISEVRGMSSDLSVPADHLYKHNDVIRNINATFEIKTTKNPKKFSIGDTRHLSEYVDGGVANQIKKSVTHKSNTLAATLANPPFISGYMDFSKFGRDAQLHLARVAVWRFHERNGRWPYLHDMKDADAVIALAKDTVVDNGKTNPDSPLSTLEVDETVIRNFSLYYAAELTPMAALFGGIVAQEITKQTGKYSPLNQYFYLDAFELLSDNVPADAKPVGSRYDHQIAIFGAAFQERLMSQNVFLVGCGALGCEYLKAIALSGLGVKSGSVHITDDDRIELSNLSRQFLFRRRHVGTAKSTSGAQAAFEMNPDLKNSLHAHEVRVEPKTEDKFDDAFWNNLSFVINALDNQIARKYTDGQCVLYAKPLFESGTLGTQANSAICLPFKTPSYSQGAVAGEEQGIAKCTLRNFPSDVLHCIEWAREKFDDLFVSGADSANNFLSDPKNFFNQIKADPLSEADTLKSVKTWLELGHKPSHETAIKLVFDFFVQNFRNAILDLTHAFPKDARNIERNTGVDLGPFWHGHKRFPTAVEFNRNDPLHLDFLFHGANVMCSVFKLPPLSREAIFNFAGSLKAEPWTFSGQVDAEIGKENDKKDANESQPSNVQVEDHRLVIADLTNYLSKLELTSYSQLSPQDFEKDVDENHHVDWVTAATNLRSFNYQLKATDRNKVRLTAGKIIPAIATTTATITGFVFLEVFKYIAQVSLNKHRAVTINLGTNAYVVEELPDPVKVKSGMDPATVMPIVAVPENHTIWDSIKIQGSATTTIEEFAALLSENHHQVELDMLTSSGGKILYNSTDALVNDPAKKAAAQAQFKTSLLDVYNQVVGPVFPPNRKFLQLEASVVNADGDTCIIPRIIFQF